MEATIELTTATKSNYFTKNSRAPSYELQEIIFFGFIIANYTNCFLINTIFQSIIESTTKKTLVDELSAKNRKSYNVKLMKKLIIIKSSVTRGMTISCSLFLLRKTCYW